MSDYTVQAEWDTKDALAAGEALKAISATELGTEFDAIAAAILSKVDTTDTATTGAAGIVELATTTEAAAGTDTARAVTPAGVEAWAAQNAAIIQDLANLSDPGSDRVFGWDESVNAAIAYTLHASILHAGTELSVDHDAATNFVANEHIDHSGVSITAGAGLTGGGTIAATRSLALDISGLTNRTIDDTAATDSFVFNNGGVMEQLDIQDLGVRVANKTSNETFAAADANILHCLTDAAATFTVPPDVFHVGACIYIAVNGTGTATIDPGAGVTLNSVIAQGSTSNRTVLPGGMAVLVNVASNVWNLAGDIA